MYINCHSQFSLRYGVMRPDELLDQARAAGAKTVALTDVHCTAGGPDFVRLAAQYGIRPVLGIDFRDGASQRYFGLAQNHAGYTALCAFLSELLHKKTAGGGTKTSLRPPVRAPELADVLWVYPLDNAPPSGDLRENEHLGVRPQELAALRIDLQQPVPRWPRHKLVAQHSVTFRNKRDHNTHRLLRAIDNNTLLAQLEPQQVAPATDRMLRTGELEGAYLEFDGLLRASENLLARCHIDFAGELTKRGHNHRNLRVYSDSAENDRLLLEDLCREGCAYRYPDAEPEKLEKVLERIEMELQLIEQKEFVAYFLVNWDITSYARGRGYFHVGRGSGANSLVAYLLGLTDVDPVELDLYFERFLNLYRSSPPDFDIDFSWKDRDDVTRYIFERFEHVALVGAYSTFQFRSATRELGKVFGLPKHEIDRLAAARFNPQALGEIERAVIRYAGVLNGLPNALTVHACGILITDQPIEQTCATFMPPKGYPTTQYDMHAAEDLGLYKFDILSQRGLAKIRDTLDIIAEVDPGARIDIHDTARMKRDPHVAALLRSAEAVGCFYIESPAMRMLLRKLEVDDYLGLVAASSVIRPGVAQSGMMRAYIERHRKPEKRAEAHPTLLALMPETYGVMVYQEDVLKVASHFAGMDLGQADVLRRAMSGKGRGHAAFEKARADFHAGGARKGHKPAVVEEVWRQIESFAGYAFAKGHSASFAVESYQSLYLKCYWPLAYMTACINNFGGFYSTEFYVHEARLRGARIEAPCVNRGGLLSKLDGSTQTIVLGLNLVKGVESEAAERLEKIRLRGAPYQTLSGFIERTGLGLEQTLLLIRCEAFRFTGRSKQALLWEAHFLLSKTTKILGEATLFSAATGEKLPALPKLEGGAEQDAFDQLELLGFSLCSPFNLLTEEAAQQARNSTPAHALPEFVGRPVQAAVHLVTVKQTQTARGERMCFGCFVDRSGAWVDTVHFPSSARKYPFRGPGTYWLQGPVRQEYGCIHIEVHSMEKLDLKTDPRYADSPSPSRAPAA